jgi:hypothetical protein
MYCSRVNDQFDVVNTRASCLCMSLYTINGIEHAWARISTRISLVIRGNIMQDRVGVSCDGENQEFIRVCLSDHCARMIRHIIGLLSLAVVMLW